MIGQNIIPVAELPYGPIIQMVIDGLDSPHSRRQYGRALRDFLLWYRDTRQQEMCILARDGAITRVIGVQRINGQLRLSYRRVVDA